MPQEHLQKNKSSQPDLSNIELADIIDVSALQEMMDDYYALTGIGVGIIDLKSRVLVSTGQQDICANFHRAVAASCVFCHESDISRSMGIPPGTFREFRCKNNLWDIATPIMLGERHIGNIFLGQFLYDDEKPDYELFRAQARRFGYDETAYLAALDRVPRWSRGTVQRAMGFYAKLARMISKANYNNVILADNLARQVQAEEALRWLRISVESSSDALYWVAPDARIVEVNETACRSLGYTREELLQLSVPDFDPHFNASSWPKQFDKLRQIGSMTFESEHRTKDGRIFPVEIVVNHVKLGLEERHCVFVRDISERKKAEESLWLMNHVFHSSIAANSIADLNGVITECNAAFLRIWRFGSRDEVVGRPIGYFLNDQDEAAAIIKALNETGLWQGEFSAIRGDGSTFIAYGMATQVRNKNGKVIGYQSACVDITERKLVEQELQQAKVAAEAANIAKSRFLATMSHEIRTPMNGVIGMIELLQHTDLTPEQLEYSEGAKKSGIELVHLLNDILEHSRIEADKLELDQSAFSLQAVLAETINLLSLSARENAVQLTWFIDSDVPMELKGDAGRLRQIIINIVGNAIKFTPEGTVGLHIRKEQEDENSVTLRFLVSDNGSGNPTDKLEQIFEPFTQADSSTTRRFGGTGLGLAICKRLTEMMGGGIGVESVEGEGSTFWFTVVLEKPAASEFAPPIPASTTRSSVKIESDGSRIPLLMAEDDPTAQLLVRTLLKHYGYEVNMAGNGKEALLALQNNDYALVLMDCMMPEMNGYEAATVIRDPASPVRRHDIPIIALTGNAMKQDRDRCIAAGMNDYISKPFVLKELLAKLDMWGRHGDNK